MMIDDFGDFGRKIFSGREKIIVASGTKKTQNQG
jgi:hypothetical protein